MRSSRSQARHPSRASRSRRPRGLGAALSLVLVAAAMVATGGGAAADGPGSPFGALDVVRIEAGVAVRIEGWAKDPDAPPHVSVHVYIDGIGVAAITATIDRPDLGLVLVQRGFGYSTLLNVAPGHHTVCTYGINNELTPGGNVLLGCKTVDVSHLPTGSFDIVDAPASSLAGTAPWIGGWAIDPDRNDPVAVHVYVDGTFTLATIADQARPDVGAAFPSYGDLHGFALPVPLSSGPHQVCVYALNHPETPGNNVLFSCRAVQSVANRPFGVIDRVTSTPELVKVEGWGIDPFSAAWTAGPGPQGTGPLETFAFTVDGQPAGTVRSTIDRIDVVAATPPGNPMFRLGGGPRYGFSHELALSPGTHDVCTIIEHHPHVETGYGAPDTTIGCFRYTQ